MLVRLSRAPTRAALYRLFDRTLLWASLMAILVGVPYAVTLDGHGLGGWVRLGFRFSPIAVEEYPTFFPAVGAVIGTWFGTFAIPLDWDRPWQV